MNESSIIVKNKDGRLVDMAFTIYQDLLKNTKHLDTSICSICDKHVGINLKRPRNHFHGSDFGKCFRSVQLDMNHPATRNPDEYTKQIFLNDGHLHEETITKLLGYTYKVTHLNEEKELIRDVKLPTGEIVQVKVVLHTDGILQYDVGNIKFIVEIKSVKDWFWKNRMQKEMIPLAYYGQAQCYMEAYNIPQTLLIFKNRHTSEISRPFVIEKDDEYIQQRFLYLAGILVSNQIPELVPKAYENKKCDECTFCEYFKLCWEK